MTDIVVRVTGLRKQYRIRGKREPFIAVKDVSFEVHRGESVAIVGESGSGKTTVANIVMGLTAADSGTVDLPGLGTTTPGTRHARDRRTRAGYVQIVFQDPYSSLDPRQRVGDALDEVLRIHTTLTLPQRRERAGLLLADVGLEPKHAAVLPRALSGGQRQRVAIARALAADPQVIVLDEAVSALDVTVQAQVLRLLSRIRAEHGVSYLFISHDLAVVNEISDRVLVMRRGEVVESGTTTEVLTDPQHPYTRMLMASAPRRGWNPSDAVAARKEMVDTA